MERILICGATGFIGSNLIDYYSKKESCKIIAIYNTKKPEKRQNTNIEWIKADLCNRDDVKRVTKDIDVVIQAAATTSGSSDIVNQPYIHVTDNAVMNSLMLRESMNNKVKHFIFFSCTVMYPSSEEEQSEEEWREDVTLNEKYYGVANTKIYIEKMLKFFAKISEMKTTAIRHSNVYGPNDKFDLDRSHFFGASISKILTEEEQIEIWGSGEEKRNLLYVDDLCEMVDLIKNNQKEEFKLYNCGSNETFSVEEVVKKIVTASGKNLKIKKNNDKPTIKTNILINSDKARRELGWQSRVKLDDGIQKTINWWKMNIDPATLKRKRNK
jgi:GDP-L-fucose synthase